MKYAEQSWNFEACALQDIFLYKMYEGKKRVMKDIQVKRIVENLRAQDLMTKRQKFRKVSGERNDRVHDCATGNQRSQLIYLTNANWGLVYNKLSSPLFY